MAKFIKVKGNNSAESTYINIEQIRYLYQKSERDLRVFLIDTSGIHITDPIDIKRIIEALGDLA